LKEAACLSPPAGYRTVISRRSFVPFLARARDLNELI